ncbi:MAG: ABC transporter substrate-binding protein [Thermodesulfobacteriota bacterium]
MKKRTLYLNNLKKLRINFLLVFFFLFLFYPSLLFSFSSFTDEVGRRVTFPFPPRRIISLAPNITEILFALGMDKEIIGVTLNCNYPERVREKVKIGSYISLDFERIVSLKPDLAIATGTGNTKELVDRLERLGIPTYVIFPNRFDGVLQSLLRIGEIVQREKEAKFIVQGMKERKQKVMGKTAFLSRPRVFLQIGEAPLVTVGKGSFSDDLIHLAGGENIAGNERQRYPRIGMEEVIRKSPEVILISSMNPKGDYDRILSEWNRWKAIPAVRQGRIHLINSDLIDRPSPRLIEGLEEMARFIHPEAIGKPFKEGSVKETQKK